MLALNFFQMLFGMIVLVTILGVGGDLLKRWLAHRERVMELMAAKTAESAAQYAAHAERLEQRVRVLERIATDKGADLAAQIEDLRDQPVRGALSGEKLQ